MNGVNQSMTPFAVVGSISIVSGGVVSAATAASPSYSASWVVAYLVLVAGVAQLVLGIGQAQLAAKQPSRRVIAAEVIAFNLANVAVIAGTLLGIPVLVYIGAALLVIALAVFVWAVRGGLTHNTSLLYGFRAMVVILIVSTPIGLVIAGARAG